MFFFKVFNSINVFGQAIEKFIISPKVGINFPIKNLYDRILSVKRGLFIFSYMIKAGIDRCDLQNVCKCRQKRIEGQGNKGSRQRACRRHTG